MAPEEARFGEVLVWFWNENWILRGADQGQEQRRQQKSKRSWEWWRFSGQIGRHFEHNPLNILNNSFSFPLDKKSRDFFFESNSIVKKLWCFAMRMTLYCSEIIMARVSALYCSEIIVTRVSALYTSVAQGLMWTVGVMVSHAHPEHDGDFHGN